MILLINMNVHAFVSCTAAVSVQQRRLNSVWVRSKCPSYDLLKQVINYELLGSHSCSLSFWGLFKVSIAWIMNEILSSKLFC